MKLFFKLQVIFVILFLSAGVLSAAATVKIRDIAFVDGLKCNQIYGFGLVVGLQGTGDSKSALTSSSLKNLLKSLGMESDEIVTKNTASVLLTAQLKKFTRIGDRVDITVSSIGDAKSLNGGILVQSSLKGADNITYAVAQGRLSFPAGQTRGKGVKTVATVPDGGIIEKEITPDIVSDNSLSLVLRNWDFSVADRIIKAVKAKYPVSAPSVTKDGRIKIIIAKNAPIEEFISIIQDMEIEAVNSAKVVINESDGTIVTGGDVRISAAMVSREGLTVEIEGSYKKNSISYIKDSANVKDLVDALNAIGAKTGDIISILKGLKESGALHSELIIK